MIQQKLAHEISLNFHELFIIGNTKIRLKTEGRCASFLFLEVKRSKILQVLSKRDSF